MYGPETIQSGLAKAVAGTMQNDRKSATRA
jgi:hypothetical protein